MVQQRTLIVDDHRSFADALANLLRQRGVDTVDTAASGSELRAVFETGRPDRVILDLNLGDENGFDLLDELRRSYPDLLVIVLTARHDVDRVLRSLRAGASAFVPKGADTAELLAALEAVTHGGTWVPPRLLTEVLRRLFEPDPPSEEELLVARLTPRERDVLDAMVAGLDRAEIAQLLFVSLNTVRTHTKNILAKLEVHSSIEAVSVALRLGWRPPDLDAG